MANASFGLGESPFIFASVCKCEGVQRIFGSITKGAPALHKLYTRERHFSLNLSGGIRRAPRQGKRVDTKVSTLLTPTSFYFLVWRRPETGDRFEKGNGRGFFLP